jgi:hypothetical protein
VTQATVGLRPWRAATRGRSAREDCGRPSPHPLRCSVHVHARSRRATALRREVDVRGSDPRSGGRRALHAHAASRQGKGSRHHLPQPALRPLEARPRRRLPREERKRRSHRGRPWRDARDGAGPLRGLRPKADGRERRAGARGLKCRLLRGLRPLPLCRGRRPSAADVHDAPWRSGCVLGRGHAPCDSPRRRREQAAHRGGGHGVLGVRHAADPCAHVASQRPGQAGDAGLRR